MDPASTPACHVPGLSSAVAAFLDNYCYQAWTHDPKIRTTDGVHPNVQVYYSPTLWNWLLAGDRKADIPEGAMLVKAQFASTDPKNPTNPKKWKLTDWVGHGQGPGWRVGWLVLGDLVPSSSPPPTLAPPARLDQADRGVRMPNIQRAVSGSIA